MASSRLATDFDQVVQMDSLFVESEIILHIIDEATRFSILTLLPDRNASSITEAFTESWVKCFQPPGLIVSDQEGGLMSEEAAVWAERLNTSFAFKPRGSHASIAERHHQICRDLIHKIVAQLRIEGIAINWKHVLAEASFAKNSLVNVAGYSPYIAVFGRQPAMLADLESAGISMIDDETGPLAKATRLREIALDAMIRQHAQDRLKMAEHHNSRHPGQLLGLNAGDLIDVYRTPQTKDLVGWRGPCVVVNTTNLEDGYVDVKWQGRVMSARIADVRRHIPFIAFMHSEELPIVTLRHHINNLNKCTQNIN